MFSQPLFRSLFLVEGVYEYLTTLNSQYCSLFGSNKAPITAILDEKRNGRQNRHSSTLIIALFRCKRALMGWKSKLAATFLNFKTISACMSAFAKNCCR